MVSPVIKQTWIVTGVLFNDLSQGMVLSFSSIMLPALLASDSNVKVDLNIASWIASVIGIGGMLGFLLSGIVMELYGRRFAYILFVISGVLGWLCLYFGTNIPVLIFGRFLGGISASSTTSIGSVVIGEYTCPKERGMFLNLKVAAFSLGNLVVHLLGQFLNWRIITLIGKTSAIVALLIACTWPESPAWFATVKRFQDCEQSFYWLRGKSTDSIQELQELIRAQKQKLLNEPISNTCNSEILEFFKKFTKKDFIKPVIIMILSGTLYEASGGHVFPAYVLQIIEEVTGNKTNTFYYTLGLDILITFAVIFSSILGKHFKRRTLLFGSGFLSLIVLYSICFYLFLTSKDIISRERTYIPVVLFGVYLIINSFGCLTVTSSLLGELLPLAHRGSAACVAGVLLAMFLMFAMQITPYLLVVIKVYGTFAVFGTGMLILLIALWFILPETKDKTLQDIEDFFNYGQYSIAECK